MKFSLANEAEGRLMHGKILQVRLYNSCRNLSKGSNRVAVDFVKLFDPGTSQRAHRIYIDSRHHN